MNPSRAVVMNQVLSNPTTTPAEAHLPLDHIGINNESLRLRACRRCEYLLTGLPATGICPECGSSYDERSLILYGHGVGPRANPLRKALRGLFLLLWPIACLITAEEFENSRDPQTALMLLFLIVVPPLAAYWVFNKWLVRQFDEQIRLMPEGVSQTARNAGLLPWENAERVPLTPWRQVRVVRVRSRRGKRLRVTIRARAHWWQGSKTVVDAIVRYPVPEADALREQLCQWKEAAI